MLTDPLPFDPSPPGLPLVVAADLQNDLMVVDNDLARLQRLLHDASESLLGHFHGAAGELKQLLHVAAHHPEINAAQLHAAMDHLAAP